MKPIVVVGTGIVGASIACHLARAGAPVTVIGRDLGVTASSFGWIGEGGDWPGGAADLSALVLPDWRRAAREVPGVAVRWCGSLRWPAATGPAGPGDVAALEPALRTIPERAVHTPADGGVDPVRTVRAFLLAARDAGARVLPGATVSRVRADGVESSAGFHRASAVVLAAGAGSAALARHARAGMPAVPATDVGSTPGSLWAQDPAATPDPGAAPARHDGAALARAGDTSPALLIRVRAGRAGLVRGIVATPWLQVREVRDRELLIAAPITAGSSWDKLRDTAHAAVEELRSAFGDGGGLWLRGWRAGVRPMPAGGPVIGWLSPYVYGAVMHSGVCLAPAVGRLVTQEIVTGVAAPELARCR